MNQKKSDYIIEDLERLKAIYGTLAPSQLNDYFLYGKLPYKDKTSNDKIIEKIRLQIELMICQRRRLDIKIEEKEKFLRKIKEEFKEMKR